MIDCYDIEGAYLSRKKIVEAISHIKILQRCCCCGNLVETKWDVLNKLNGKYQVLEYDWSEILECKVADATRILCNKCFGTGLWKKRGVRWD